MKVKPELVRLREGEFTFICPSCGHVKIIQYGKKGRQLKIKCRCGFRHSIALDHRKQFRKECNISGILYIGEFRYYVNILNISFKGYCVEILRLKTISNLVGDEGFLEFTLPDKQQNHISDNIVIRNINNNLVGLETINLNPYSESQKAKGFWLMP